MNFSTSIRIHLKKTIDDSYTITIEPGVREKIPELLARDRKYAIITDKNVDSLYGEKLVKSWEKQGLYAHPIVIPAGEKFKTCKTIEKIAEKLLAKGFDRSGTLIALGGGVIGDITGFSAACFMRGIAFVQVPTTLLAMVDASLGGKTGVNLPTGKNMIGAFYQPKSVFIDPEFLKSLPEEEYRNGLAEIVKHAVIFDETFFQFLEKNVKKILDRDLDVMNKIIVQSCKIKAKIIEKDEKEKNMRMLLNYGHTFGHALEQIFHYKIPHGRCVAEGMKIINRLAVEKKLMETKDANRIKKLLSAFGFPEKFPRYSWKELQKTLQRDKKFRKGKKTYIIAPKIGKGAIMNHLSLPSPSAVENISLQRFLL